jgi:hypothetical protein
MLCSFGSTSLPKFCGSCEVEGLRYGQNVSDLLELHSTSPLILRVSIRDCVSGVIVKSLSELQILSASGENAADWLSSTFRYREA